MSKIRIKFGTIEIEYEGEDQFIKDDLESVLEKFVAFCKTHSALFKFPTPEVKTFDSTIPDVGGGLGTTRSIAAKLVVKSGPELIIAAAAFLTFSQKKTTFTRQELIEAIKSATGYFQKNHISNLSKYLKSVVDNQQLVEVSNETYALHQNELKRLGEQLAN